MTNSQLGQNSLLLNIDEYGEELGTIKYKQHGKNISKVKKVLNKQKKQ
jgi:hypothetical protein